jgi:hypothetical protein
MVGGSEAKGGIDGSIPAEPGLDLLDLWFFFFNWFFLGCG